MKKQGSWILLMLTLFFCGLSVGFFVGRNYAQPDIQLSAPHESTCPSCVPETIAADLQTTSPEVATANSDEATEESQQWSSVETKEDTEAVESSSGLINVNTADQQALTLLPGIGDVLSQRIIEYRDANGPFASLDELLNINGIGQKRLESLIPFATVGG